MISSALQHLRVEPEQQQQHHGSSLDPPRRSFVTGVFVGGLAMAAFFLIALFHQDALGVNHGTKFVGALGFMSPLRKPAHGLNRKGSYIFRASHGANFNGAAGSLSPLQRPAHGQNRKGPNVNMKVDMKVKVLQEHEAAAAPEIHVDSRPVYLAPGSIWPGSQTKVRDHMSTTVMCFARNVSLKTAAKRMMTDKISGAPVVDDNMKLLGIISRSDLVRVISSGRATADALSRLKDIEASEVGDSMTKDPVTISPDATILEAAQVMYPRRLNRLLVVNDQGMLVGIVTSTDVIRMALCDECSEINYDGVQDWWRE